MTYRTDLTERLITIPFLIARRPYSRKELSLELGVDVKTISNDINALTREYPIDLIKRGREVFYSFPSWYTFQVPLLTPEEVATLLLAHKAIEHIGITTEGSPYSKFASSLLQKVRDSLPHSIRSRMELLSDVYGSSAIPAKNFATHIVTIDKLASAAIKRARVKIKYHGLLHNKEGERVIEPYAVYFDPDGATLKVIANDTVKTQFRVFSIDRIKDVAETGNKFTKPIDFNLQDYLNTYCFNGIHGEPILVRLRAYGVTARIFAERTFHPSQKIIKKLSSEGNDSITIELKVARGKGLIRFILGWLPEIEVISPSLVREELKAVLKKSLREYFQ